MSAATQAGVLELEGITLELTGPHGAVRVLEDVSMTVGHGEIVGLVGESGSGKSVTANSVLRLLPPAKQRFVAGSLRLIGRDVVAASEEELLAMRGRVAAMIFQEPMTALNPVRRIASQICEVIQRVDRVGYREAEHRALMLLDRTQLGQPQRVMRAFPHELSGGMRQRVLIAMAFSCRPRLVIADEPTTALDVTVQAQIVHLLREQASLTGSSVLFISHDLALVAQICDRVYVMDRGRIVEGGTVSQVIGRPQAARTRTLLAALPERQPQWSSQRPPSVSGSDGADLLRLAGVSLDYGRGGGPVLESVSLAIRSGETLAIVGESGSGKTSIARVIAGIVPPTAGDVFFEGEPLSSRRTRVQRKAIQLVFQDPRSSFNPAMPIWRLVTEPLTVGGPFRVSALRQRATELLSLVGLDDTFADRRLHELSGGQRQRLAIARALAPSPKLVVLDEPTSALDLSVQAQVLELLKSLRDEWGLTFLFISHDIGVVRLVSDRVAVMRAGRIVESGATAAVLDTPQEAYTRELLNAVPRLGEQQRA